MMLGLVEKELLSEGQVSKIASADQHGDKNKFELGDLQSLNQMADKSLAKEFYQTLAAKGKSKWDVMNKTIEEIVNILTLREWTVAAANWAQRQAREAQSTWNAQRDNALRQYGNAIAKWEMWSINHWAAEITKHWWVVPNNWALPGPSGYSSAERAANGIFNYDSIRNKNVKITSSMVNQMFEWAWDPRGPIGKMEDADRIGLTEWNTNSAKKTYTIYGQLDWAALNAMRRHVKRLTRGQKIGGQPKDYTILWDRNASAPRQQAPRQQQAPRRTPAPRGNRPAVAEAVQNFKGALEVGSDIKAMLSQACNAYASGWLQAFFVKNPDARAMLAKHWLHDVNVINRVTDEFYKLKSWNPDAGRPWSNAAKGLKQVAFAGLLSFIATWWASVWVYLANVKSKTYTQSKMTYGDANALLAWAKGWARGNWPDYNGSANYLGTQMTTIARQSQWLSQAEKLNTANGVIQALYEGKVSKDIIGFIMSTTPLANLSVLWIKPFAFTNSNFFRTWPVNQANKLTKKLLGNLNDGNIHNNSEIVTLGTQIEKYLWEGAMMAELSKWYEAESGDYHMGKWFNYVSFCHYIKGQVWSDAYMKIANTARLNVMKYGALNCISGNVRESTRFYQVMSQNVQATARATKQVVDSRVVNEFAKQWLDMNNPQHRAEHWVRICRKVIWAKAYNDWVAAAKKLWKGSTQAAMAMDSIAEFQLCETIGHNCFDALFPLMIWVGTGNGTPIDGSLPWTWGPWLPPVQPPVAPPLLIL